MASIKDYNALACIQDPVERQNTCDWLTAFEELATQAPRGSLGATIASIASRMGASIQTAQRKWNAYQKYGASGLVNRAKLPRPCARHSWESVYMRYCEDDLNTSSNAWRQMMHDFRTGQVLEGIGTWRDVWQLEHPYEAVPPHCPSSYIPQGASYQNLQRAVRKNPDRLFSLAMTRRGRKFAHAYLLPVLQTRIGLPVGAITQYDDVWHNTDVLIPGQAHAVQPLEFAGYDVASGFKRSSLVKPRFERADGKRDNLKEQQFRYLFAFDHIVTGFHSQGITDIVEHGTTAIRENVRRQIAAIPGYGRLITIRDSGILSEQAHAGLFIGNGGGNFRMKALCESAHNILHNRLASLPGSRGRDAEHMHESHAALVKYEERLALAASHLPSDLAVLIQSGLLTFDQYMAAFKTIEASLMDDPEHHLEGWDNNTIAEYSLGHDDWHNASELLTMPESDKAAITAYLSNHPECRRLRSMSRREVWANGQKELIRVPDWEMPAFLDAAKDAVEIGVADNGLITIRNELYFGRDALHFQASAMKTYNGYTSPLPPRSRVLIEINPLISDKCWILSKEDGHTLGVCPIYNRASAYDRHSIEIAMGAQQNDLANKLLPIRGRHQAQAEARAQRLANNLQILQQGSPTPPSPKPITTTQLTQLATQSAAQFESDTDNAADIADFLTSITHTTKE